MAVNAIRGNNDERQPIFLKLLRSRSLKFYCFADISKLLAMSETPHETV